MPKLLRSSSGSSRPRPSITFGVAFASRHRASVMASLSTVDARTIAQTCSRVVVAVEGKSKADAAAAVQLADRSATFEFSALLPTEERPEPGYELAVTTHAESGYAGTTVRVDATQIKDIILTLSRMAEDLEAAAAAEEAACRAIDQAGLELPVT